MADLLIQEGADVNAIVEQSNALLAALCGSHRSLNETFLASEEGKVWRQAAAVAQEATIHLLLEKGADVNSLGGCATYPLQTAAVHCSPRVVQSIIDKGADVNAGTAETMTALKPPLAGSLQQPPLLELWIWLAKRR